MAPCHPVFRRFLASAFALCCTTTVMADDLLLIDDRRSGDTRSNLGSSWRLVTDGVMGGVSSGELRADKVDGRDCLRISGEVRLENNGGFVQAALNLADGDPFDVSPYQGLELDVHGNGEQYNLHLRSADIWLPWQSYRASFSAGPHWRTVRLPFADFTAHRTDTPLNLARLERIGIVAIGRAFQADLCVARLALYRDAARAE